MAEQLAEEDAFAADAQGPERRFVAPVEPEIEPAVALELLAALASLVVGFRAPAAVAQLPVNLNFAWTIEVSY